MSSPSGGLRLHYAALSDLGRYRKDNQDSGLASEHLLVIADGVGGAAYGDVASHTAIQIMRRLDEVPDGDLLEALAGAIHRVHDRLAELVEQDPELDGTSTTITAGLFDGSRIAMAHLGDSRAYLLRNGEIKQITKDHTFVQTLIDEGRITEEEARSHPHRNLILRAVDGVHDTEPDLFYVDLQAGDRLLFCSDGCSGVLDDHAMAEVLGNGGVDFASVELVRTSLDLGTTDNVTVVVADVVDAETPADPDSADASGPLVVGAAAAQPRKLSGAVETRERHRFRRHDTGEIPTVEEDIDPEEMRYALRPPRRMMWLRRLALLVVLLLVAAGLSKLAYDWTQEQYFVAEDADVVAIFQGVDFDLPVVEMNHVVEHTDIPITALPAVYADRVRESISAESLDGALETVASIESAAVTCPEPEPEPKPRKRNRDGTTPTPTPTPTPSPTPTLAPPYCLEATP
ncbi:MAG TPA: protein phosphatase 2C domain-containing protein [Nocardioidaceae bacterium]|nr:protein phosphatase 2C domain-containing protein [Nocardioidaceae bacterium]